MKLSEDYSYLINKKSIIFIYKYIFLSIIFFLLLLFFIHALFSSHNNVIEILGTNISLYYIPPFFLCLYSVLYSFYRVVFVVSKRLIKGITVGKNISIKLFNGKEIILTDFEIIIDQSKIEYKNKDQLGGNVYKKYDYEYIGIKNNNLIYLLPYKEESKNFTIELLYNVKNNIINS
ncbi:hypothetical protein ACTXMK_10000 [Psychrobacter celer]|uniref:hypothetical protein n=1 Tax=Psychrobacter celer TaxID=306572 RepID=UPI003FD2267E